MIPRGLAPALALVLALGWSVVPASGDIPTAGPGSAAAAEPSELKVRWPGGKVRQGRKYVVTGKVSGGQRKVLVQRKIPGGWFPLGKDKAGADGRFKVRVDTRWVAQHRSIRVHAPATATHDEVSKSRKRGLTVTRSYRPRGGTAWRPISEPGFFKRERWTPCGVSPGVITYRVNPRGLPRGGLKEIKRALGMVTAASGFAFRYLGKTNLVPIKKGSGTISRGADVTIAFATPKQVPALRGPVIATTPVRASAVVPSGFPGAKNWRVIEAATVVDRTFRFRPGFAAGRKPSRGATLIHEFGHAVGLDHVRDRRQVMYPSPTRFAASYAKGDLRGLSRHGVAAGCFPGEFVGRPLPPGRDVRTTIHSTSR